MMMQGEVVAECYICTAGRKGDDLLFGTLFVITFPSSKQRGNAQTKPTDSCVCSHFLFAIDFEN
jgi:hypothetical protein